MWVPARATTCYAREDEGACEGRRVSSRDIDTGKQRVKALVYTRPGELKVQDRPMPGLEAGHVLVRVRATGICGSDLDGFLGRSKARVPPLVLGHEFCGVIEEAQNGSNLRAG